MAEPFMAEIIMFGGSFAPRSWTFCDGQLQSIATNQALFSLLGTIYGGDGRTSFGIPELRGRIPVGHGRGPGLRDNLLGQRGGTEREFLNHAQLPQHTHTTGTLNINMQLHAEKGPATSTDPEGNMIASHRANAFKPYNENEDKLMALQSGTDAGSSVSDFPRGGSESHSNLQPSLTVNFIIAVFGLYPSRN